MLVTAADAKAARATQDTLLLAARAAAEVSPTAGTVVDVLEHHALGHYSEGLRQYLTIRLGSVEKGLEALAQIREQVAAMGVDELLEPPGIKARVFRMARELSEAGSAPKGQRTLVWYRPPPHRSDQYLSGLSRLRADPVAADRELLELRYARELSVTEMAFVLQQDEGTVAQRLTKAEADARALFEKEGRKLDLPKALLEAFALDRVEREIASAAVPERDEDEPFVPIGTILDDQWELEKYIGSGGFADVYRARDLAVPGHHVALKILKRKSHGAKAKEAALRELRLIAAVFHPSIVQFKDHGWHQERLWFAMPWYEGETLEARLEREPLTREEAKRIFVPLARALSAMHAAGVRHQDVKPDNIFLARIEGFGEQQVLPVLLDLGVAATDAELVIAGTPTYFAPEVAAQFAHREGDPVPLYHIGPAADVFALALSLRNALEPSTAPEVTGGAIDAFIRDRSLEMPELPASKELSFLEPHFEKWLSLDPTERPTAAQLADQLEVLTRPEEVRARRMRNLRIFGPLAVAFLAIFGVVTYELWSQAAEQAEKTALLEAERSSALENLEDETERREALEGEIADARTRIESSNLGRTELAEQLASAEGQLGITQRRLTLARREADQLEKRVESINVDLSSARSNLATARSRVESLEASGQATERQLTQARRELTEAQAEVSARQSELQTARAAAASAGDQLRQAQARIAEVTSERDRLAQEKAQAESALATARARIAALERQLAGRPTTTTPATPATPTIEVGPGVVPTPGSALEGTGSTTTGTRRPAVRR